MSEFILYISFIQCNCLSYKHIRENFLPFTYTRSVADIRCGILTMREKWEVYIGSATHTDTVAYLQNIYTKELNAQNYFIAANIFPDMYVMQEINALASNSVLKNGETVIAYCLTESDSKQFIAGGELENLQTIQSQFQIVSINHPWDIFSKNYNALRDDFNLLTANKNSQFLSKTNTVIGSDIFIAEGAKVEASILNATTGPIYIGKNAEVMEGCIIRGPFAMCDNAQLKMGAKIYGATTLGPNCKVGGEVNNAVFFANSSKAHDGFIGNSVIGEWCNLGADSNNSNLKNNYEEVKLWSEAKGTFVKTGLQFCGLMMADHSKCGINTMFNTGTVVGVSANIFGAGFPRNFIPSYSWGGASGFTEYKIDKALQTMKLVFARRNKALSQRDIDLFTKVFELTSGQR
jgi:UDP-N-acetylglucosamine diphosphorylase/glucosamine-1-phosphate N-acetyltransferase